MNNIYVDELPIKVAQRVIYFEDGKLNCVELMFDSSYEPEEIKLITDRLAEERKKVVQEIREPIIKSLENGVVRKNPKSSNTNLRDIILFQMLDILDQIERGK